MSSVFVSLVDQLAKRHGGVQRHNAGLDADEQAARLFLTSCDLVAAFRHADICTHLEDMMLRQWPQLLPTEPVTRTTTTTTAAAASAALPTASVPTLIAASGALVGFLWTHTDGEEVGSLSREWVCAMHNKWESAVLQVLGAYPPFSAEACTAACYAVGQLSLLPGGCCSRVLAASCAALQAGSEDGLTAVLATELLGQCTSLMVLCKPFELRGALLVDPAAAAEGEKKKRKSAAGSAQPGKRARPATQRPSAPEGKEVTAGGQAAEKVDASASTELTLTAATAESCTALPSCYPFPTKERVAELRAELIECCLAALGAPAPSSSVTVATTVVTNQSRTVPTALVCQRVLIPLLLLDGSAGLERYEALIHNLLHTLATRADASADRASRHDAVRNDGGAALRSDNCDDVVLLIAALFDFLFRQPSCDPATDFRFSPFLWDVLSGALHHSLTATEMDAGHRANMQLRVEYLLKRIVYLTKGQGSGSGLTAAVVDFHPLFRWCRGGGEGGDCASATSWDNFFLVLESLNEYGWHIIEPVMARLDTLIADLNTHLEACHSTASAATAETTRGALHTQWIEMLLLKLILHPNVGVRKVGLRRVWGLPLRVVQSLSPSFLFQYTFQSASDPRLCTDLDRVPITASFLDTKAFEGTEVKAVPDVEPLAQEVERFYSAVFLSRWQDCAGVARDAGAATTTATNTTKGGGNVGGAGEPAETCLVSTRGRIDALQRLLDTSLSKPPRFTVCVLARTLLAIGQVLFDHKVNTEAIILDEGVLRRLHRFMRDSVQENIPFWLDVRVTAVLFAALTTFAAATPAPQRCRQHPSFWRLYCMCGPLGESGGHSITGMDACGQYGLVGASVDERFLQQWLVDLSGSMAAQQGGRVDTASGKPFSLVSELLDVEGIAGRVGRLLAPSETATSSSVNVVEVKETFFLLGTLNRTGAACDAALVRAIGHLVASAVASLQARSYCSLSQLLSSAACLVEYHHTVGSEVCARVWPLRTTLQAMSTALHTHAMGCLSAALHAVVEGSAAGRASVTHASAASEEDVWPLMSITHFDIVAAAVAAVNTTACYCANASDGDTDAHSAAADVLGTARTVEQLMSFISEATAAHQRIAAANRRHSEAAEDAEAGAAALLVVLRNAYRLLQSVLCGLLNVNSELVECEGGQPFSLPTHRGPIEPTAVSRCPPALRLLPSQAVLFYLRQLIALPACRVPTVPVPSALSDMPWSTLLGHHGRYRSNILYVLLLCLRPAAHAAGSGGSIPHDTLSPGDYRDVVALVQDFALGQLEECWTMNLASVYDLLVWVASSDQSDVVDFVAIARGMFDHMKEVGARQHTRLAALAFSVLPFVMPHHPDYVRELLLRVLAGEGKEAQTADRDVYFAAMTASLQVLRNPTDHWPVLRPVLLYAALLFNTNRDEEENESTVAVTEPLLWSWPAALRLYYPPTTRMSAVGRAMAVATLLWCCQADVAGRAVPLTMELLQMNVCHPVVTHEPCMPNSRTHRTRIRLWQLLCALLPSLAQTAQPVPLRQVEEVFRLLIFHCVTVNNMGSVRRLMELYAIRLVEQHPGLYTVISEALGNYSLRPQVCGTYILIACHALLRQEERGAAAEADAVAHATFDSLFPRILQQSTSNQHLLRIISHIGLVNICQRRIAHGRPLSLAVQAIYDYVLHAPEHIKFREKHEHMLFFDTDDASSPRNLFCVQRKEANTVLAEVLPAAAFERIRFVETELCCMIGAFYPMELLRVRDWCATLRVQELVSVFKDFAAIPHTDTPCDYYVDYTQEATELLTRDPMAEAGEVVDAAAANVQKKVSSWWTSEVYNELHPRALRTPKQPLIVVGSLLENPVNIAGLCRCGEIFAVESIVVPEKKVFEHPHFVAAARSAELWIPWEEVLPKDLPGYLESLRRQGYTIVGIEQTANSISMEAFAFPERCAVVLGAEGQGVPAPLIPLLDVCVEIPQYGLIRSLNVHVTGAIAMYEYTRQHLMGRTQ